MGVSARIAQPERSLGPWNPMAARVVEEPVVVGEQRLGHEVAAGAWRNIGHGIVGREDVRACPRPLW